MKKFLKLIMSMALMLIALIPVQATDYYQVQVGYQAGVNNILGEFAYGGALAGTENGAALNSLEIHLIDSPYESGIEYRVNTSSGWSTWFSSWQTASNNNEAILGLEIQLKDFPHANVYYQTYRQGLGWSNWVENGGTSGTLDSANPITGFRVKVDEVGVEYISNVGGTVQGIRHNRETQGSGLIYTVQMGLISSDTDDAIEYRAHFMNSGWSEWSSNMAVIGSERSGDVITGLEARLVGLNGYHVGIQPQVDGVWWDWAYDGAMAGSYTTALTAYRIQIVQQVYVAPTPAPVVVEEIPAVESIGANPNTTTLTYSAGELAVNEYADYRIAAGYPSLTVNGQFDDNPAGIYVEPGDKFTATLLSYTAGSHISIPDSFPDPFDEWGDNSVDDERFEVYYGTYVNGIFEVTSTRYELADSEDYDIDPRLSNGATHTLILYDNDTRYVLGNDSGDYYAIGFAEDDTFPTTIVVNGDDYAVNASGYIEDYTIVNNGTNIVVTSTPGTDTKIYVDGSNMILDGFILSGVFYEQGWYVNTEVSGSHYMYYDIGEYFVYDGTGYNEPYYD